MQRGVLFLCQSSTRVGGQVGACSSSAPQDSVQGSCHGGPIQTSLLHLFRTNLEAVFIFTPF